MIARRAPGAPSPNEPITDLRRVAIAENGEPLVDFLQHPRIVFDEPYFRYERLSLARAGLVERLWRAADRLPAGLSLCILEGWRPLHIQRRMYLTGWRRFAERHPEWTDAQLRRVVNRFTAPLDRRVPPPHSTGGAVDLGLAGPNGERLDFRSPYDLLDPHGFPFDAPELTDVARRYRDLLASVLLAEGVTNYPSEWWHWSYGDQGWAYRGRHAAAVYGQTSPIGYEPPAEDDTDEPLVLLRL